MPDARGVLTQEERDAAVKRATELMAAGFT